MVYSLNRRIEIHQLSNRTDFDLVDLIDQSANQVLLTNNLNFFALHNSEEIHLYQNQGTRFSEIFDASGILFALSYDQQYFIVYGGQRGRDMLIYIIKGGYPSTLKVIHQSEVGKIEELGISQSN